jgi:hypothetical protein
MATHQNPTLNTEFSALWVPRLPKRPTHRNDHASRALGTLVSPLSPSDLRKISTSTEESFVTTVFRLYTAMFDLSSEPPADRNYGNAFYGRDLAEWIEQNVAPDRLEVIEEDWGWLVLEGLNAESNLTEFSIYGYPDPIQKGDEGEDWIILVNTHHYGKKMWFFRQRKPVATDPEYLQRLRNALEAAGIRYQESTDLAREYSA